MNDPRPPLYYCMDTVPKILRAGIYHNPGGGVIDHSEPQIGYLSTNLVLSGGADLEIGGPGLKGVVRCEHTAGDAFLWQEGDTITGHCGDSGMVSVFARFVWPDWKPRKTGRRHETAIPHHVRISLPVMSEMRYAYYQMIEAFQNQAPGWEQTTASYLRLILALMHAESLRGRTTQTRSTTPAVDRRLRLAVEFMQQHLHDTISVGAIAEYASLSEDYFRRLFVRQMGVRPIRFLEELRVKEAKRRIAEDPGLSVGLAGREVGFSDQRYFCRIFKRHFGVTPGAYRKGLSSGAALR